MKKFLSLLAVGGALFSGGVAQAQAPGMAPGGSVTTETTTTTGAEPGAMMVDAPTGTMPTTGGAPIAMALCGALTAAGGFFVRRKLS